MFSWILLNFYNLHSLPYYPIHTCSQEANYFTERYRSIFIKYAEISTLRSYKRRCSWPFNLLNVGGDGVWGRAVESAEAPKEENSFWKTERDPCHLNSLSGVAGSPWIIFSRFQFFPKIHLWVKTFSFFLFYWICLQIKGRKLLNQKHTKFVWIWRQVIGFWSQSNFYSSWKKSLWPQN